MTIGGCHRVMWLYPNVGNGGYEVSMLLSMMLAESSNLKISTRGLGYYKEIGMVWMWLDMYRDCGEYISTWLERVRSWGSKGMDGCPLTDTLNFLWKQTHSHEMHRTNLPPCIISLCYPHTHTPNLTPHICSTTLHHLISLLKHKTHHSHCGLETPNTHQTHSTKHLRPTGQMCVLALD
jgi:hypothetical protein